MGGKRAKLKRRAKAKAEGTRDSGKDDRGEGKDGKKKKGNGARSMLSLFALLLFFTLRRYRDWSLPKVPHVPRNVTFAGVTFPGQARDFPTLANASASAAAAWDVALDEAADWAAGESCGFWGRGGDERTTSPPAVAELEWSDAGSGSGGDGADYDRLLARRLVGLGGCPVVLRGAAPAAVAGALSGAAYVVCRE